MELDKSAKVASIASVAVGALVSLTTWYTNLRIQDSQEHLAKLIHDEKQLSVRKGQMEVNRTEAAESSRIIVSLSVPLARSFALQYQVWIDSNERGKLRFVLPEALSPEIMAMWPSWASRNGLMSGDPCEVQGLLNRLVVLLDLQNEGKGDAVDIVLHARLKKSPAGSPETGWREAGAQGALAYSELHRASAGWESVDLPLPALPGSTATDAARRGHRVVLASVSGRTELYGTVIVPITLTWTDRITGEKRREEVLENNSAMLNAELTGAEVGRMKKFCAKVRAGQG